MSVTREQRHTKRNRCPVCGGADGDTRGKAKRCHGFTSDDGRWAHCSREDAAGPLEARDGLYCHLLEGECNCGQTHGPAQSREPVAEFDYRDAQGRLVYQVVRFLDKQFRQRKPKPDGGWEWKLNGTQRVPYRLPELLAADASAPVLIVEGEKDVETARALGFVATCNPGGAGKWSTVHPVAADVLRGRDVVVIADADKAGRDHAADVVRHLRDLARSLRHLEPPSPHKDLTDWVGAGASAADVLRALQAGQDALAPPEPPEGLYDDEWRAEVGVEPARVVLLDWPAIDGPLDPLEYLCEPIGLVAGAGAPHLLAGFGFSGKTLSAQSLALSLAAGLKVWAAHRAVPRRVLHVDMEQGERLTRLRYQRLARAMGAYDLGDRLTLTSFPALTLSASYLDEWLGLCDGRDLVIVDSLRAATGGLDENSSEIRASLDMLGRVAEKTGCRALVIHHARKPSDDKPGGRYAIRGSGAIYDACDSVYVASAAKGEPVLVEHVKARSHGEPAEDWALVIDDVADETTGDRKWGLAVVLRGHELVQETRDAKARERKRRMVSKDAALIAAIIKAQPGLTSRELSAAASISGNRIRAAIEELGSQVLRQEEKRGRSMAVRHFFVPTGGLEEG